MDGSSKQWEAGRETDAAVAEHVMGLTVAGRATVICADGEWSAAHPFTEPEGWMCYAERAAVFVDHCGCERGPYLDKWDESFRAYNLTEADVAEENARRQAEWDQEKSAFGHPASYLAPVPHYSEDIASAWLVVERMRALGCNYFSVSQEQDGRWVVQFYDDHRDEFDSGEVFGDTAALAICRAALEAMGHPTPEPEPSDG